MSLFRRGARDAELADEIATHLALAEDEYRRAGMSDEEARDAARRAFGGELRTRQIYREQRGWRWLDGFILDARTAARLLTVNRGFALVVMTLIVIVLTLSGVGLYATTAQAVYQRNKEFGIRLALGAQRRELRLLVARRAALHVSLGLTFGVFGTMAWSAAFGVENLTSGQSPFAAPEVLMSIAVVLLSIMAMACALPIRHAVRVNPVTTLRQD